MAFDILGFTVGLLEGALGSLIAAFLLYAFRNQIISSIKRFYYWASDSPANIDLRRIDKYGSEPHNELSHEVFREAQSRIDNLSLVSLDDDRLRVEFETKYESVLVDVILERNIEATDELSNVNTGGRGETTPEYRVLIETVPSLTFGYQNFDSLEQFRNISETLSDTVQAMCFDGERPEQTFAIGEMRTRAPAKSDRIEDEDLGMTARYEDSTVRMDFENPQNVIRGIKRYFTPL